MFFWRFLFFLFSGFIIHCLIFIYKFYFLFFVGYGVFTSSMVCKRKNFYSLSTRSPPPPLSFPLFLLTFLPPLGISRSSTMLICYVMQQEGKTFQAVAEEVKRKRDISSPNAGFMCQLTEWGKVLSTKPINRKPEVFFLFLLLLLFSNKNNIKTQKNETLTIF